MSRVFFLFFFFFHAHHIEHIFPEVVNSFDGFGVFFRVHVFVSFLIFSIMIITDIFLFVKRSGIKKCINRDGYFVINLCIFTIDKLVKSVV